MHDPLPSKPHIIVVALDMDPNKGSEPGKGWWWACALSHYFQLHVITQKSSQEVCETEALVQNAGWNFYPTVSTISTWAFPSGYRQYHVWLQEALVLSKQLIKNTPISGLCHVTLGSFRMLPRYDTLGIPYTIGPLGGGECAPLRYLWPRSVPIAHKVTETFRPILNNAFALVPGLRSVMRSASMVLATSRESEKVVSRMGAKKTQVVFPDAYDNPIDVGAVTARREAQQRAVKDEIRLLWQGRPLWWKGPDIALRILHQARTAGVKVRLTMVGSWDNPFGARVRTIAEGLQVSAELHLVAGLPRPEFLQFAGEQHGFVSTSVHDSGGIPLIEAQAFGLPCFTPGLGGNREAACPEAGVVDRVSNLDRFVQDTVECLLCWQADPKAWFKESQAAVRFAGRFTNERLQSYVQEIIAPSFADWL